MLDKKKIVQIVKYPKNKNFLDFRFSISKNVDIFIFIIDNDDDFEIGQNKLYSHQKFELIRVDKKENFFEKIVESLLNLPLDFEDILIFSNENEFTDFENFHIISDELFSNSIVLKHTNFWWSLDFFEPIESLGSLVFFFTKLLTNPKVLEFGRNTKIISNFNKKTFENGWSFNYFVDRPKDSDIFIKNLHPYNSKKQKLIRFQNQFKLPNSRVSLIINPINLLPKTIVINIDDIKLDSLPKQKWYGENYAKFLQNYQLNEVYREIKKLTVTPNDICQIIYNNETYTFMIDQLKNRFLSEIINPS